LIACRAAQAGVSRGTALIRREQRADLHLFAELAAFPIWILAQRWEDAIGVVARAAATDPDLLAQSIWAKLPQAPELRSTWATWRHSRRNQEHSEKRAHIADC
jgi:hypothetical protein